jgi:hypothetical protein
MNAGNTREHVHNGLPPPPDQAIRVVHYIRSSHDPSVLILLCTAAISVAAPPPLYRASSSGRTRFFRLVYSVDMPVYVEYTSTLKIAHTSCLSTSNYLDNTHNSINNL